MYYRWQYPALTQPPVYPTLPIVLSTWFKELSLPVGRFDIKRWQWLYPSLSWEGYPRPPAGETAGIKETTDFSLATKTTTDFSKSSKNTTDFSKSSKATTDFTKVR